MVDEVNDAGQARLDLLALMELISEQCWYAGWFHGIEYDLWSIMQGGCRHYGHGDLDDATLQRLQSLSLAAGGWYVWGDDVDPTFTPLDAWTRCFALWTERQQGR